MALRKETFTTEIDSDLAEQVREVAAVKGVTVDVFVADVLRTHLRQTNALRPELQAIHEKLVAERGELYRHLSQ